MKVYFASDHAGFELKNALISKVKDMGYEVEDLGPNTLNTEDDYPDYVTPLAKLISSEPVARGVILGGSGQGEAMCANRVPGVRAAVFYGPRPVTDTVDIEGNASEDEYVMIRLSRRHNDANVLSIGARFITAETASHAVRVFLETAFSEAPRHARRIAKF